LLTASAMAWSSVKTLARSASPREAQARAERERDSAKP